MTIPHLDRIRSIPEHGQWLYEALQAIQQQATTHEQQTNSNPKGAPQPPPPVDGVKVTGRDGYLHVAITDNGQIFRGIRYYCEHADNPHFTDAQIVPMHDSRNVSIPVGNQARYVRVFSAYSESASSAPVYHGGAAAPKAVNGGGSGPGPAFLPSQGSGTGAAGQGLSGPGPVPFRSATGAPPVR
jgi:hypothetical protein